MNDPRVTATARSIQYQRAEEGSEIIKFPRWLAEVALTAADAADREQGIHRVKVDEATVERVYAEISHNLTPVIGRNRLRDRDGEQPEPLRPHIEAAARAVLAALIGAES